MKLAILAGISAFAIASGGISEAGAAVIDVGPSGFQVQETARIAAPPDRVYAALIKPGEWWNPEHSYSHDAGNMTLSATAGGCWCEKWSGGSVVHMTVVFAAPGKTLRLTGALGPLQALGVAGTMTWTLTPSVDGGTVVTLDYAVGGYSPDGFTRWASAVDGVLAEQMGRLQLYVQTGSPTAVATH